MQSVYMFHEDGGVIGLRATSGKAKDGKTYGVARFETSLVT